MIERKKYPPSLQSLPEILIMKRRKADILHPQPSQAESTTFFTLNKYFTLIYSDCHTIVLSEDAYRILLLTYLIGAFRVGVA